MTYEGLFQPKFSSFYYSHCFLMLCPCACSICAAGWWIQPGNLSDQKITLAVFFAGLLFQSEQSSLIQFAMCLQSVSAPNKRDERWECAGKSGNSGIWKLCKWSLSVQWLNVEPCFGTETFCLTCLVNSYCMWCSINYVFWNHCKAILKEKYSYWISTVIYLPALLPSQSPVADHLIYVFNKCETEYSTAFLPNHK